MNNAEHVRYERHSSGYAPRMERTWVKLSEVGYKWAAKTPAAVRAR